MYLDTKKRWLGMWLNILKKLRNKSANLFIRINKRGPTIRVFLHQKGQFLKEIPVNELVDFFTGQGAARLLGIEHSVVQRVSSYRQEFAEDHEIELEHLNVLISYNGKMDLN